MTPSVGQFGRHWAIYSAGAALTRLLGFLLIPLYTRYLLPADYGELEIVVAAASLLGIVLGLGLGPAVIRFYRDDADHVRPEVVTSGLALAVALHAVGVGVALAFAEPLAETLVGSAGHARAVRLALGALFFSSCLEIPLAYLRASERAGLFVATVLAQLTLALALNVLFVIALGWGIEGILASNLITSAAACLAVGGWTLCQVGCAVSRGATALLLRYGAPTVGAAAGWFVVNFADRLFLAWYGSLHEVGIYSLANRFSMVVVVLAVEPLRQTWEPLQFQVARDPQSARLFPRIFELVVGVLAVASVATCLFADDVIRLLTPPLFWAAGPVVPLLVLAGVLMGLLQPFHTGIVVKQRTELLSAIVALGVGVNVLVNRLAVPAAGAQGAAAARVLAFLVIVVVTYQVSQRLLAVDFQALRPLRLFAWGASVVALAELLPATTPVVSLGLKGALLMAFGVVLWRSLTFLDTGLKQLVSTAVGLGRLWLAASKPSR